MWEAGLESERCASDKTASLWDEFQPDINDMRSQAEQMEGQNESKFRKLSKHLEGGEHPPQSWFQKVPVCWSSREIGPDIPQK